MSDASGEQLVTKYRNVLVVTGWHLGQLANEIDASLASMSAELARLREQRAKIVATIRGYAKAHAEGLTDWNHLMAQRLNDIAAEIEFF